MPEPEKIAGDQNAASTTAAPAPASEWDGADGWDGSSPPAKTSPPPKSAEAEERSGEGVESPEAKVEEKKETAGEEGSTVEGETAEEPIDLESLPPKVREKLERLDQIEREKAVIEAEKVELARRKSELETKVGEQGRELGAARQVVQQAQESFEVGLQRSEQYFQSQYNVAMDTARQWDDRAQELRTNGDEGGALAAKAAANKARQDSVRMQNSFDRWSEEQKRNRAMEVEKVFLEHFPQYQEIQKHFESFCLDVGVDPQQARMNLDSLAKIYPRLLAAERGREENLKIIKQGAENLALQGGRAKQKASGPESGTSGRAAPKPKDGDWTDEFYNRPSNQDARIT